MGFAFGFVGAMAFLLGINSLYRGAWLVIALSGLLATWFSYHPRLSQSRQTGPFLWFFGLTATAIWMISVGPSPIRILQAVSNSIPYLLFLASAMALLAFFGREDEEDLRFPLVPAFFFCLTGWMVAYFSGASGGADPMVKFLTGHFGWSEDLAHTVVIVVRKTLHFAFYGTVGLTAATLARLKDHVKATTAFGLVVALTFASFDEFRQSTSVGRTASVWDVGLDMLGAFCFVGLLVLSYRRRSQREQPSLRPLD